MGHLEVLEDKTQGEVQLEYENYDRALANQGGGPGSLFPSAVCGVPLNGSNCGNVLFYV